MRHDESTLLAIILAQECNTTPTEEEIRAMRYNETLGEDDFDFSDLNAEEDEQIQSQIAPRYLDKINRLRNRLKEEQETPTPLSLSTPSDSDMQQNSIKLHQACV